MIKNVEEYGKIIEKDNGKFEFPKGDECDQILYSSIPSHEEESKIIVQGTIYKPESAIKKIVKGRSTACFHDKSAKSFIDQASSNHLENLRSCNQSLNQRVESPNNFSHQDETIQ